MDNTTETMNSAYAQRERSRFDRKVIAFVPVDNPGSSANPWQIGVAVLGEAGYMFPMYRSIHSTYDGAADFAEVLNDLLGHSRETATVIIAETMSRSSRQREKADTLTGRFKVEFDLVEPFEDDDEADNVATLIEEVLAQQVLHGDDIPLNIRVTVA